MAYQVLARKYRPQTFGDVVGQRGVTQTLRNALSAGRLAQAFVFAGPRGVGKTTTARILARALNCASGPTPDPCGTCDACIGIAAGRDIDVLEIDAATHTQVENIREVVIAGLAMAPVRDRYKVFIIDEVHQLSSHSFNALLKSIEEPPPHVIFMMATTQIEKIPDTILSRSQVHELRTISTRQITEQLRSIADAERIAIDDAALALVARAADGSMRDAQSAFDQVIAFAGESIGVDDVSTVLGLIGRDPVLDAITVVADEDPAGVFTLAGRFVEAGYDLRQACRELSRAVRDLLVLSVDPARADDPEIVGDGEQERLLALAGRFSREDLLRAFDVLSRAESEIRSAAQPRHHFEMALLRWIHLRKLTPLADLLQGRGAPATGGAPGGRAKAGETPQRSAVPRETASPSGGDAGAAAAAPAASTAETAPAAPVPGAVAAVEAAVEAGDPKPALLAEIKRAKKFFYGTVVAQAQRIDLEDDRLVFVFTPTQRTLAGQVEANREWLEGTAAQVLGRRVRVAAAQSEAETDRAANGNGTAPAEANPSDGEETDALRAQVEEHAVVKAMLEVFPAQITRIEKIP